MVSPYGLKLQRRVDEWFLVCLILRAYSDFFAPIILSLSSGVLFSAYMFVDPQFLICVRFVVYDFYRLRTLYWFACSAPFKTELCFALQLGRYCLLCGFK